ncbi:MAG TPA: response regulator [Humisphaera sp.]|nr:response regulator [Humisphaera sp.]
MSRILVVDDDHNAVDLFATILRHHGHQVTAALSGKAALDHLGGETAPHLVILDMMMPNMNGLEVLQQIRADARTADLQVVIFSALDDDEWRDKAVQAGADDYWVKGSFDCGGLEQKVRSRLPA